MKACIHSSLDHSDRHTKRITWWMLWSISMIFHASVSLAASEEIQVYTDDKEDAGAMSVDFHNNYAWQSRNTPQYLGEQAPDRVFRFTPEFNLGLSDSMELGLYLLGTHSPSGDWNSQGYKVRLKFIAPHEEEGFYWGLNFETGRQTLAVAPTPNQNEFKTILGWNSQRWKYAINFNTAGSSNSGSEPVSEEIAFKINYALDGVTQMGIESYNDMGPIRRFEGWASNSKTLFAVIDSEVAGHEFNAGIGRGLNNNSDQWIFKFIVNQKF